MDNVKKSGTESDDEEVGIKVKSKLRAISKNLNAHHSNSYKFER